MAENEVTPYGQVIADGQSTVTLASALVDLVARPASDFWTMRRGLSNYRKKLGEWAGEAMDQSGNWLQPILSQEALEDHLVSQEGHPVPTGTCQSSLAWAQFLYALNIRPGTGVVSWRKPTTHLDPALINLVVEGAAMCHIINLFRVYDSPAPAAFSVGLPDMPRFKKSCGGGAMDE